MQRCGIINKGPAGIACSTDKENGVSDDFKKAGFRLRPRVVEPSQPGRIAFDERGHAVYSWNDPRLGKDGADAERARRKALDIPNLTVVEDEPEVNAPIRNNVKGVRIGYNPYESGLLSRKAPPKKRDLRELSKWLEMKKRITGNGND
jgi:hypothetical protein